MTFKSNPGCECKFKNHIGAILCEFKCRSEYSPELFCKCKGFIKKSNESLHCEVAHNYFDHAEYDSYKEDIKFQFPADFSCQRQEGNTFEWSKFLRCEKYSHGFTQACS